MQKNFKWETHLKEQFMMTHVDSMDGRDDDDDDDDDWSLWCCFVLRRLTSLIEKGSVVNSENKLQSQYP